MVQPELTFDQLSALFAKIDNLQAAGLVVDHIDLVRIEDGKWVVRIGTIGNPFDMKFAPPEPAKEFIISQWANIRWCVQPPTQEEIDAEWQREILGLDV